MVLAGIGAVILFFSASTDSMRTFGMIGVAAYLCFLALVLTTRASVLRDSALTIGILTLMTVGGYYYVGLMPAGALTTAFVLVLTVLVFGMRMFSVMLAVHAAILAVAVFALSTGAWQGPDPTQSDPGSAAVWVRTGLIAITVWATIGLVVLYVLNTIERVSEKRRAALDDLQTQIEERQAAEQARRKAEEVASEAQKMEAVGQLAAGIAHDVNNALLVIRGWNELRGDLDDSKAQRDATSAIEQAATHTAQLTRQLLTFARKEVRSPRYLYLDDVVRESVKTLQALVGSGVEIDLEADCRALVHADESQLQQLLFNLVINARDAMDGEGTIRIRVSPAERPEAADAEASVIDWASLEIEDSGPGIPEEAQRRIFEPFFTTKTREKGTGLGRSTVLGIVQQSAGHIKVDSAPGRTVFSVFLPLVDSEREQFQDRVEITEAGPLELRILVLEDDELAREIIVAALERSGNVVAACADGDAAVDLLATDAERFDLLCTDAEFPGARLELVLAAFDRHSPGARVLICSGYIRDEAAIREIGSGDYAFLPKPFTGSQLTARIRGLVGA